MLTNSLVSPYFSLQLHNLQKLVKFYMSQTELVQTLIKKHAQLECLDDADIVNAFVREIECEEQLEDTLVQEASANSVLEVPLVPDVNAATIDSGVPNFQEVQTLSPAKLQSRKSECLGSRFIRVRNKIDLGLANFEKSEVVHSEALLSSAKSLASDLSKLIIEKIVTQCESDPDLNEVYGGTVESIID